MKLYFLFNNFYFTEKNITGPSFWKQRMVDGLVN